MLELKNIPYLVLDGIDVPVNKILDEVSLITDWTSWVPPGFKDVPTAWERHKNYLHFAITTIDPDRNHKNVFERYDFEVDGVISNYFNVRKWYFSKFAEEFMPETCAFIQRLSDRPILAKVIKTPPGHILGWHSHQNDSFLKYHMPEQAITHIPLITSKDVCHFVSKNIPTDRWFSDRETLEQDENVWGVSFEVGKVSILNGYYPHMMKNYSNNERYTILIYNDLDENVLLNSHIKRSLENYTGEIIS